MYAYIHCSPSVPSTKKVESGKWATCDKVMPHNLITKNLCIQDVVKLDPRLMMDRQKLHRVDRVVDDVLVAARGSSDGASHDDENDSTGKMQLHSD